MSFRQQVVGLNRFLSDVFGTDTRLSTLLSDLGFTADQIDMIRRAWAREMIAQLLEAIEYSLTGSATGKRKYRILSRRYGLDGEPANTLAEIGTELGISRERVRQIQATAIRRCHSAAWRQRMLDRIREIACTLLEPEV